MSALPAILGTGAELPAFPLEQDDICTPRSPDLIASPKSSEMMHSPRSICSEKAFFPDLDSCSRSDISPRWGGSDRSPGSPRSERSTSPRSKPKRTAVISAAIVSEGISLRLRRSTDSEVDSISEWATPQTEQVVSLRARVDIPPLAPVSKTGTPVYPPNADRASSPKSVVLRAGVISSSPLLWDSVRSPAETERSGRRSIISAVRSKQLETPKTEHVVSLRVRVDIPPLPPAPKTGTPLHPPNADRASSPKSGVVLRAAACPLWDSVRSVETERSGRRSIISAVLSKLERGTCLATSTTESYMQLEQMFDSDTLAVWNDETGELAAVKDAKGTLYEVEERVGEGVTGEVFKVADPDGERFAMKVVPQGRIVKAEVKALERLQHPNVVKFHGAATSPDFPQAFLFFEFIDGGQLCDVTSDGKLIGEQWSERKVRLVAMDLVSAVFHLHQKGVAHRDIKPQNCLLRRNGEVVLCDFGASEKASEKNDTTRRTAGTPFFHPPEATSGQQFGTKAQDAWGLGVTLYLLLHGEVPFGSGAKNGVELQERMMNDELVSVAQLSPGCRDFLERTLEKNITARMGVRGMRHHPWLMGNKAPQVSARSILASPLVSGVNKLDVSSLGRSIRSVGEVIVHRESDDLVSTPLPQRVGQPAPWSEKVMSFSALSTTVLSDGFCEMPEEEGELLRVLVANDDTNERTHLVRRITSVSKQGEKQQTVDVCGDAVLQQLDRVSYQVVFLPLHTFLGDAAELAEAIRAWEECTTGERGRIKLVATAPRPTEEQVRDALEAGIDDVLETPARLSKLCGILQEVGWATRLREEIDLDEMYDSGSAFDTQCRDVDENHPLSPLLCSRESSVHRFGPSPRSEPTPRILGPSLPSHRPPSVPKAFPRYGQSPRSPSGTRSSLRTVSFQSPGLTATVSSPSPRNGTPAVRPSQWSDVSPSPRNGTLAVRPSQWSDVSPSPRNGALAVRPSQWSEVSTRSPGDVAAEWSVLGMAPQPPRATKLVSPSHTTQSDPVSPMCLPSPTYNPRPPRAPPRSDNQTPQAARVFNPRSPRFDNLNDDQSDDAVFLTSPVSPIPKLPEHSKAVTKVKDKTAGDGQ
eukprot:Hpha_TRINITY_DN16534_c0_g1::TRINITY_DN16534_c0_g1_i1::g.133545::m.133545